MAELPDNGFHKADFDLENRRRLLFSLFRMGPEGLRLIFDNHLEIDPKEMAEIALEASIRTEELKKARGK